MSRSLFFFLPPTGEIGLSTIQSLLARTAVGVHYISLTHSFLFGEVLHTEQGRRWDYTTPQVIDFNTVHTYG